MEVADNISSMLSIDTCRIISMPRCWF